MPFHYQPTRVLIVLASVQTRPVSDRTQAPIIKSLPLNNADRDGNKTS